MTVLEDHHPLDRRARLLALLLGVPIIMTALGVSLLETWRWVRPDSPLFTPPAVASMAAAIANNDPAAAYEFIRAGQDPNRIIAVRHPVLTGGHRVEVLPLLWAVANQSDRVVAMLLGFGARLDTATTHQATCLAERLDRDDIVQLLQLRESDSDAAPEPCSAQGSVVAGLSAIP